MKRILPLALAASALVLQACGCEDSGSWKPWDALADTGVDNPYDTFSDTAGDVPTDYPSGTGAITGVVFSPEPPPGADPSVLRNFPISGALVYLTYTEPEPIPEGVYCHECVEMPETQPHDMTNPDGSFTISNLRGGTYLLVVQKGEFRKVRYVEVVDDTTLTVPVEYTTFPNEHHPESGDNTPSIAVALGSYDDMQDILAKIGLCDIASDGTMVEGTCNHIDFYDNTGWGATAPSLESLLRDPVAMDRYHIIFVPCSSSATDTAITDPTVQANVRRWVEAGGKWYVADWSYDLVEQVFPQFLDFEDNDAELGAADMASGSFNTIGRAMDTDLRQWIQMSLVANPDSIDFLENWDCIAGLGSVPATDPDGTPITITPDIYCEGPVTRGHSCMTPNAPLTLTFPYGCGKILFTTYHTVGEMGGPHPELLMQEKILVYMILEIGLCTDPVIII